MQYVDFGKTGLKVSRFGMGCMRYPKSADGTGPGGFDEAEAIRMIQYAVDHGVNYFDTAYIYPESEQILGKALAEGSRREKAIIATKMFMNQYETPEKCLDEQLAKLQVDEIDLYLLHGLGLGNWKRAQELDLIGFVEKMKQKGKVREIGFSFHAGIDQFKEIVDSHDWAMCQIELNYLDENYQAGVEGLRYAAQKSLPVVVMEPLKGGVLTDFVPAEAQELCDASGTGWSPAQWGLRWVANLPEVSVVLSGVSSMPQLRENIDLFSEIIPGCLTAEQKKILRKVKDIYLSRIKVGCTGCGYCLPCPAGIMIPLVFRQYIRGSLEGTMKNVGKMYTNGMVKNKTGADQCLECGLCEKHCPQHIAIIDKLKEAHLALVQPE